MAGALGCIWRDGISSDGVVIILTAIVVHKVRLFDSEFNLPLLLSCGEGDWSEEFDELAQHHCIVL